MKVVKETHYWSYCKWSSDVKSKLIKTRCRNVFENVCLIWLPYVYIYIYIYIYIYVKFYICFECELLIMKVDSFNEVTTVSVNKINYWLHFVGMVPDEAISPNLTEKID